MSQREKYNRLLDFLRRKSVLKMENSGVKVADLVQALELELKRPSIVEDSIQLILDSVRIATKGKITWETMDIPYGKEHLPTSILPSAEPNGTADFWNRSSIYPLRQYKK